jgi:hypothetical protein
LELVFFDLDRLAVQPTAIKLNTITRTNIRDFVKLHGFMEHHVRQQWLSGARGNFNNNFIGKRDFSR